MNPVRSRSNTRSRKVTNLTLKNFPEEARKVMRKRVKDLEPTRGKLSYAQYIADLIFKEAKEAAREGLNAAPFFVKSIKVKQPDGNLRTVELPA